jgi:AraC-like DNA-binding protein
MAMILKVFQFVLGMDWTPVAIHVTSPDGYWLKNHLPSSNFKLKTNCPEIAVCFKTRDLAVENKYYSEGNYIVDNDVRSIESVADNVFNSLNGNYIPTIDEFSDYFGYSKRTLIRGFSDAGTSYKEMVEKHLYMRALRLLRDNTISIEEVSFALGYAHCSNFIRTFKRWTSTTPNQYRQQESNLQYA